MHSVEPVAGCFFPTAQFEHAAPVPPRNLPSSQAMHAEDAVGAYLPSSQFMQAAVLPALPMYLPTPQSEHDDWPAGHEAQELPAPSDV
jgi:hypothetical protein